MNDVTRCEAGRVTDAAIAEQIMGYRWLRWPSDTHDFKVLWPSVAECAARCLVPEPLAKRDPLRGNEVIPEDAYRWVPCYSTSIAAAWDVVEKMREQGRYFSLSIEATAPAWMAVFADSDGAGDDEADTAPLAICRAALLAVASPRVTP